MSGDDGVKGSRDRRTHGRGTPANPGNRFECLSLERDPFDDDDPGVATEFLRDTIRSIITYNDSPDVGFDASINPNRGCEHGCVYCYARPSHEYLGFSAGLDFETRILVREDAPDMLRKELSRPKWTPQPIAMSGVTDPYQPGERRLGLTRECLGVLAEYHNPVVVITKSDLVARDGDILGSMADWDGVTVYLSVTTLDRDLAGRLEPRAATPSRRLAAIESLAEANVPVGVLVAPVIPGLTDHELPRILEATARAGARFAGYVTLRLPHGVSALFEDWMERCFPDRRSRVMGRLRSLRSGNVNDPRFGSRMRGEGAWADEIRNLFQLGCRRAGIGDSRPMLSTTSFRVPSRQARLFD